MAVPVLTVNPKGADAIRGRAVGAFRLERLAGGLKAVQDDVRAHVNAPGLHGAPR